MTTPSEHLIVIPGEMDATQLEGAIGKLRVRVDSPLAPIAFQLWDCFDQSLRQASKVLVEFDNRFLLISGGGGCVMQSAQRSGNFVSDLESGPVKQGLRKVPPLRALLVSGAGQLEIRRIGVLDSLQKTQARAVVHTLRTEDGVVTLVLMQRLRGYDKAFAVLETALKHLATAKALVIDAFQSIRPNLACYTAKPDFGFGSDTPIYDVVTEIIEGLLDVAHANEAGIVADHDTEFLHDYRVAIRKIRSVLNACKGVYSPDQMNALNQSFDDLMAPTGRLRDLDVQELDQAGYFEIVPENLHPGLHLMARAFHKQRMAEHRKLAKYLSSRPYQKTIRALAAQVSEAGALEPGPKADQAGVRFARKMILKRYKKLQQAVQAGGKHASDAQLHDIRVHCKRLRYALELFAPLFPSKGVKPVLKSLKKAQEDLGAFNDCVVQQDALQRFLNTHAAKSKADSREIALSVGGVVTVLTHRQSIARAKSVAHLSRLGSPEYQKNLRQILTAPETKE
ncbi:CHAD domain-containing protein [Falsiruegeria litorea]|uniref:CHAD domain-containing protein n=1 Tax=Falsiruegeria litorea TaxID=1280831 RepID=A0ABS5WNS3_9RHOB|nr:CHAD domain-containing protein [Falsiruegeria litorea]MBT3140779.1 CHAD domain-containing protein [Falsiruegeria litorea]MBT8170523.1 CHAD domain-containing protein [Falsiruegeria litorea]